MLTRTLRSIVTDQKLPALGSDDDGDTISKAAQWLANQGRQQKEPVTLDYEGLRYICETTIAVRDFFDFTHGTKSGATIQSNKDWGTYATADEARNRCHLLMRSGDKAKVDHPFRITGPHSDLEPNKSPGYVLEQQCGIWFQSVTEIESRLQDIDHVWGDFIDIGFAADDTRRTTKAVIVPGRWERCGRVAFNAGGTASHLEFCGDGSENSYIKRCPGDIFHCEIQTAGGAGFEDWNVHDLVVYQNLRAHLTGMNYCKDIRIHNNTAIGGHIFFQIMPRNSWVEGIVAIQDNLWNADPGGPLLDANSCRQIVITGNRGPVDARKPLVSWKPTWSETVNAVIQVANCPSLTTSPNAFDRVM